MKHEDWIVLEDEILELFQRRCVRCPAKAVTAHHMVPRSLDPSREADPDNLVALCHACHIWSHVIGTKNSRVDLLWDRQKMLAFLYPDQL